MQQNSLDADAIFMYKTIDTYAKHPIIVTELATIGAIAFIETRCFRKGFRLQLSVDAPKT